MTWVRLDDDFDEHPAIEGLSDGAFRLLVCSLTYCARNLTDGFVPEAKAPRLSPTARPKHVAELVAAGNWLEMPGGYEVRNFLEFNRSRAEVEAQRDAAATRMRRVRQFRKGSREQPPNHEGSSPNPVPDPALTSPLTPTAAGDPQAGEKQAATQVEEEPPAADAQPFIEKARRGLTKPNLEVVQ